MFLSKSVLASTKVVNFQSRPIFSKIVSFLGGSSNRDPSNPVVFLDMIKNGKPIGRMTFELYAKKVPKTAENFRSLCVGDNKYEYCYKGSHFHRIRTDHFAQGGDYMHHRGTGGFSIYGPKFDDEVAGLFIRHDRRGLLSMASNGPNDNRSQFFITFCPVRFCDGHHVVFGEMLEGEAILADMEASASLSGRPENNFTIAECGELKDGKEIMGTSE